MFFSRCFQNTIILYAKTCLAIGTDKRQATGTWMICATGRDPRLSAFSSANASIKSSASLLSAETRRYRMKLTAAVVVFHLRATRRRRRLSSSNPLLKNVINFRNKKDTVIFLVRGFDFFILGDDCETDIPKPRTKKHFL